MVLYKGEIPPLVPPSTPNRLVFPVLRYSFQFQVNPLTPELTGGRITHQEVSRFFSEIQKPADEYISYFKFMDSTGFIILRVICAILFPLVFFLRCYIIYKKKKAKKHLLICREKMKVIADEQNRYLEGRGVKWAVPPLAPLWVELWMVPPGQSIQAGFQNPTTQVPTNIPTKIYPQTPQEINPLIYQYPGYTLKPQAQNQQMFHQNQYHQGMYAA